MAPKPLTPAQHIAALQERIYGLEAQRRELLAAWKPRAETAELVSAAIDAAAARYARSLDASLALAARPQGRGFSLFQIEPSTSDVADALCFLLGDVIKTRLTARMSTMYWRGPAEADQPQRIADVEAELDLARLDLAELTHELKEQLA